MMLVNMRPTSMMGYISRVIAADAKHVGNLPEGERILRSQPADLHDVGLFELGASMSLADSMGPLAVLLEHVGDVGCGIPHEEMVRAHAPRVVAMVADHCSWRDRPDMKVPRESVGGDIAGADTKRPVSAAPHCACPDPAVRGLGHVSPEPGDGINAPVRAKANQGAEPSSISMLARTRHEWLPTIRTDRLNAGHRDLRLGASQLSRTAHPIMFRCSMQGILDAAGVPIEE